MKSGLASLLIVKEVLYSYYISAMCLISYKSRLYFALVKSILKLQSY